jgi:integrase
MALYKKSKNSKVWWMDFRFNGERIQESTKCTNKREAEKVMAARRTELALNRVGIVKTKKKAAFYLKDALDQYFEWARTHHRSKPNTLRSYQGAGERWLVLLGNIDVRTVTKELIDSKVTKRANERPKRRLTKTDRTRTISPATVNRDIAFLKLFFNYLVDNDIIEVNPASRVKKIPGETLRERVVNKEEEQSYLAEASEPLQDFASILFDTGMRPQELMNLTFADINFETNTISVKDGKTKAARRKISMTRRVFSIMKGRLEEFGDGLVFTNPKTGKAFTTFKTAHASALRRSGVKPFRLYDARHTFATRFVEATGDLGTLMTTLGHSNLQMVMRYAHPTERHQADCIRKMEAL